MAWIDTHAHIVSDELFERFDEVIENAIKHDVDKIVVICGSMAEVERALSVCEGNDMFDLAIGVHPTSTKEVSIIEQEAMFKYLEHPQVKFVGEIGLDYYWDDSYKDLQIERLVQQINIANEFDLPIIIHIRSSSDDVFDVLRKHTVNRKGIVHCFTEDVESAKRFVDLGYYVGVGGIITFKNGDNIRDLVHNLPFDKILSETDSPYLAPVPKRGKRNESAYVSYVGEYIARLKGMSIVDTQKQLRKNYDRLIKK